MPRRILPLYIVLLCLAPAACKSGSETETPTSPTPPPEPPPPVVRVIEFTPDTPSPVGEAVALTVASRAQEQEKIALAVTAYNLVNHTNNIARPGVLGMWGRVTWDDELLENDRAVGIGDLMREGGVTPICCSAGEPHIQQTPGTIAFSIQRPTGSPHVSGSGEVFLFRLRLRAGVTEGTGRVEFTTLAAPTWPELIRLRPISLYPVPQNVYGGTFTIR